SPPIPISPIICPSSIIPVVDLDLPLEEADVLSFSDDSMLRGIESDHDSGEDTTSIDALSLDDSMILSEYESFTFDDEPVMAEVNVFEEINTSELSYPGIGENVEEEDSFTFTIRSFLPFVTYPEVLPASYSTGNEDKVFKPGIFDDELERKSSLTLDTFIGTPSYGDSSTPLLSSMMNLVWGNEFSGFWKIHGSNLWKDKAMPTISIDDLQFSLHKERIERTKRSKNSQKPTRNERDKSRVKKHPKIKAGSADTARMKVKSQKSKPRTNNDKCANIQRPFRVLKVQGTKVE
ncbi:hypothetical protein Tco_0683356, partial [Tanacetum coccineum]